MTASSGLLLLGPTARAMTWGPFVVGGGFAGALVAIPAAMTLPLSAPDTTTLLRVAAMSGALGVAFLLDDPAARSITVVPTSRLLRQAVRILIALPVLALWWAAVLTITVTGADDGVRAALPLRDVTVEAGGIVALALGLAAVGLRRSGDGTGSAVAVPGLLIWLAMLWFLPDPARLFVMLGDPRWHPTHQWWVLLLVVAVLTALCSSHESAGGGRVVDRR